MGGVRMDASLDRGIPSTSASPVCADRADCAFMHALIKKPALLAKYTSLHHYCRGGGADRCARLHAQRAGGTPHANLLPDGTLDPALTGVTSRVLVVDDTPVFLKLAEGLAAAHVPGAEVLGVESGAEALRALDTKPFDLVITDYHMPEMDGGELVNAIRLRMAHARTPIIVYTTDTNETRRAEVLSTTRTRWVAKSPDRTEFTTAIRELLFEGRA